MAEKRKTGIQTENKSSGWVVFFLRFTNILFLLAAILLIGRIFYLQHFYTPNPAVAEKISPAPQKLILNAMRGDILATDGRVLATTIPQYQIFMDCTVRKEEFANDTINGKKREERWCAKAKLLSERLAEIYGDKTAENYYAEIMRNRKNGSQYVKIGEKVDHKTLLELNKLPLFNEGRYRGGYIVNTLHERKYPYDSLARRTIGYINKEEDLRKGIEGKYDYILHGTDGYEFRKRADGNNKSYIVDLDSARFLPEHGRDIRTTINIDMQDIVDRALREQISAMDIVKGGCAVLMEVKTGAIRAMTNLQKDNKGIPQEQFNYAVLEANEPGSVFKAVTLMTLLEDKKVTLETIEPTHYGSWKYSDMNFFDDYITSKKYPQGKISVLDAFKISSNNIFRQLTCKYYAADPRRFVGKFYEYRLTEAFDFDLDGLPKPQFMSPDDKDWKKTSLPSLAIGYSIKLTPLHILTFYNAIAGKGRMMKPYLVESFEQDGEATQSFSPVILNGAICSRDVAETLTKAMMTVVTDPKGTAHNLATAKCKVAAKTGTARIALPGNITGKGRSAYEDKNGNKKHQASLAGFFPAENPQYSLIIVLYSYLGPKDLYGAKAAPIFKRIVDEMYVLNMIEE